MQNCLILREQFLKILTLIAVILVILEIAIKVALIAP
jgi:hypothetical protein